MSSVIKSKFNSPKKETEESVLDEETPYINEKNLDQLYQILDVKHQQRTEYIKNFIEKLSYVPAESRDEYRADLMRYLAKQR